MLIPQPPANIERWRQLVYRSALSATLVRKTGMKAEEEVRCKCALNSYHKKLYIFLIHLGKKEDLQWA